MSRTRSEQRESGWCGHVPFHDLLCLLLTSPREARALGRHPSCPPASVHVPNTKWFLLDIVWPLRLWSPCMNLLFIDSNQTQRARGKTSQLILGQSQTWVQNLVQAFTSLGKTLNLSEIRPCSRLC